MRFSDVFGHEIGEELVQDGVNDPNIFKAIFVVGGPGSGKSFIAKRISKITGMRTVDPDMFFEYLLKKVYPSLKDVDWNSSYNDDASRKAVHLARQRMSLFLNGRMGIIYDGTGRQYEKIKKVVDALAQLGYDQMMVFVNTDLETAVKRNQNRDRTVPSDFLNQAHKEIRDNLGKYQALFGGNLVIVDNGEGEGVDTERSFNDALKFINRFLKKKSTHPAIGQWMATQKPQAHAAESVELQEYAINTNTYGEWIDTKNKKLYPVEFQGHEMFVKDNSDLIPGHFNNAYTAAFDNKWVRVSHDDFRMRGNLEIYGHEDAIRAAKDWFHVAIQRAKSVRIELVKPGKHVPYRSHDFSLPHQREKLMKWLGIE